MLYIISQPRKIVNTLDAALEHFTLDSGAFSWAYVVHQRLPLITTSTQQASVLYFRHAAYQPTLLASVVLERDSWGGTEDFHLRCSAQRTTLFLKNALRQTERYWHRRSVFRQLLPARMRVYVFRHASLKLLKNVFLEDRVILKPPDTSYLSSGNSCFR